MAFAKTKCITMPIGQKQVRPSRGKLRKSLRKGSKRIAPDNVHNSALASGVSNLAIALFPFLKLQIETPVASP